ncbi:MAG TPA: trypsin-like peptidase domain-containing protein [Candidatus Eisenbacteria bacterium]|nr:trypsin-like peptidase domain-containing protein [Candidatus Eisenbacteria bacterium]
MNTSQHKPMRKRFAFATAVVFAIAMMITIPLNGVLPSTAVAQQQRINSDTSSSQSTNSSSNPLPLRTIFKQLENSVVQITSKPPMIGLSNPSNQSSSNVTTLGSGFVYDKQGHIVTNGHVVGDAMIVDVTFVNGNRYTAKVIANDIYSDIAVLQILQNASQPVLQQHLLSSLKPLVLGNSSNAEVGDSVIAIGNPFGLSDTMTTGIVSGIGRLLPSVGGGFSIPNAIQTDAPVNPGNSGGPLLDTQGKMIGMNTAILSGASTFSGIGFAIPSNTITKIVPILIEKGYYPHAYLGLTLGTLTSELAQDAGIPTNLKGVYVNTVTRNGPADKVGIHGSTIDQYSKKHLGDIIIAVDGKNITKSDDVINYIGQHKISGNDLTLTLYRNGHAVDFKVTLAARPSLRPFLITLAPPSFSIPHPPTRPPTIPAPHP